jgi:hypothetical protein
MGRVEQFVIQRVRENDYLTEDASGVGWANDPDYLTVAKFDSFDDALRRFYQLPLQASRMAIISLPVPPPRIRFAAVRRWWKRLWCNHDMERHTGNTNWGLESWFECRHCGFQCNEVDLPWL